MTARDVARLQADMALNRPHNGAAGAIRLLEAYVASQTEARKRHIDHLFAGLVEALRRRGEPELANEAQRQLFDPEVLPADYFSAPILVATRWPLDSATKAHHFAKDNPYGLGRRDQVALEGSRHTKLLASGLSFVSSDYRAVDSGGHDLLFYWDQMARERGSSVMEYVRKTAQHEQFGHGPAGYLLDRQLGLDATEDMHSEALAQIVSGKLREYDRYSHSYGGTFVDLTRFRQRTDEDWAAVRYIAFPKLYRALADAHQERQGLSPNGIGKRFLEDRKAEQLAYGELYAALFRVASELREQGRLKGDAIETNYRVYRRLLEVLDLDERRVAQFFELWRRAPIEPHITYD